MEGDFKAIVHRYCHYVHFGTPHSFNAVVHTSNFSNNFLSVMQVLTVSKNTHYSITNVCVENLYVDVNVYLTL